MADDGISYTTCAASAAKAFQRNRGAHSGGGGTRECHLLQRSTPSSSKHTSRRAGVAASGPKRLGYRATGGRISLVGPTKLRLHPPVLGSENYRLLRVVE